MGEDSIKKKYSIDKFKYLELKYYCRQQKNNKHVIEVAYRTDPAIALFLVQNVCRGTTYEQMPVPCGRRQFYETRRKFFYELAGER